MNDAERYYKLRDLMSRNVKETWEKVENLGAIGACAEWNTFNEYLEELDVDALHNSAKPVFHKEP